MNFVFWTGLVEVFLGALTDLVSSCRVVEFFVHLKHPYQRLQSGVVRNSLELGILNAAVIAILLIIGAVTAAFEISSPIALLILIVLFAGIAFAGASLIGFLITPLFRHFILRLFLVLEAKMPLKCVTFLDYASEIRILEKDGGHWRFRHEYLQEYFARLVI